MLKIPIKDGWRLYIIEANEQSPMPDHERMDLAADDENKRIFAFDTLAIANGLDFVEVACREYIAAHNNLPDPPAG